MEVQQHISSEKNKAFVGDVMEAIVENKADEGVFEANIET